MPYTEAHRRADAKYKRESTTQIGLRFYNATEGDLIGHLAAQPNKQGYIKRLIREDMERGSRGGRKRRQAVDGITE